MDNEFLLDDNNNNISEDIDFEVQPDYCENGRDLWEHHHIEVDKGQVLLRIDKFLVSRIPNTSFSKLPKQNASE